MMVGFMEKAIISLGGYQFRLLNISILCCIPRASAAKGYSEGSILSAKCAFQGGWAQPAPP